MSLLKEFIISSLGNLNEDEFIRLSSEESHQHLLVAFASPNCAHCQDYYYPLVQALHAFRGVDVHCYFYFE